MTPLALHPENPHYFLFRGKPTILVTSAEHYGSVVNLDFDYKAYLKTLKAVGLNHTRVLTGIYHELPGSFNIEGDTMAPGPQRFACPWMRSSVPGAADGGNRFDLNSWNEDYFHRLKEFCREAGAQGIVVEVCLFCPFYIDAFGRNLWEICPLHPKNNINNTPDAGKEVYSFQYPQLLRYLEKMIEKIVIELNSFDNIYYEICNEPYFDDITNEWQMRIADVISKTEESLPFRHLISQNVSNGYETIENPSSLISIFNFHYAPGDAVRVNYGLNRVIGCNETGFCGTGDFAYRSQAWEFILSGGALFNNLDYSFAVGYENGAFAYGPGQPGGGGISLRKQYGVLRDFIYSFDFIRMKPDDSVIKRLFMTNGTAYVLSEPGKAYAVYIKGYSGVELDMDIPEGRYTAEWVDTRTGEINRSETVRHPGGRMRLASPDFKEDISLRVRRID